MLTIAIPTILVILLGLFLWFRRTDFYKNLKNKNREMEKKEEIQLSAKKADTYAYTDSQPITTMAEIPPFKSENWGDCLTQQIKTTKEINQSYTLTNTMTIPHELPIKLPATIRPEIIMYYDSIKKNIQDFDVAYDLNDSFKIKSKDNVVKSIKVINGEIEIKELAARFVLLDKENNLFINLAREEFERRAVQDEIDTAFRLDIFSV